MFYATFVSWQCPSNNLKLEQQSAVSSQKRRLPLSPQIWQKKAVMIVFPCPPTCPTTSCIDFITICTGEGNNMRAECEGLRECENWIKNCYFVMKFPNVNFNDFMISWLGSAYKQIQTNEVITNSLFNLSHWLLFYFRKSQNASDNQRRCMSNWFV